MMNYNHPAHAYTLQPQQFGIDDWMQNQLDHKAQFNGGYVRNPTAQTLPRLIGYPADDISWMRHWSI